MPKIYKANGRVTIGGGDVYNSTEGERYGGHKFLANDTAELTDAEYKRYKNFFTPVAEKKQKTENTKEAKAARNK